MEYKCNTYWFYINCESVIHPQTSASSTSSGLSCWSSSVGRVHEISITLESPKQVSKTRACHVLNAHFQQAAHFYMEALSGLLHNHKAQKYTILVVTALSTFSNILVKTFQWNVYILCLGFEYMLYGSVCVFVCLVVKKPARGSSEDWEHFTMLEYVQKPHT